MNIEISALYFVLVAAMLALIALPAFRFVDDTSQPVGRFAAIDGLRGFLAFSVFVFHVAIMRGYVTTGVWQPPHSPFFGLLGPVGVSIFFMITGFLFWTKLLNARGKLDWRRLYQGRLLRIAPMYLFTMFAMLLIVFAKTGFTLREPMGDVFVAILKWLQLGIVNWQPDVNGYPATHVVAGVTWTISYEWAFYASLIVTAVVARRRGHLYFVASALVLALVGKFALHVDALGLAALFLCGMTVASLVHEGYALRLRDRGQSILAITALITLFTVATIKPSLSGYSTVAAMLLAIFFYCVCSGASLFGLLLSLPARRLGHISYSIYLFQGIVLTTIFSIDALRNFALASVASYWVVALLCAAALVTSAALTYFFIELPGMRYGHRRRVESAGPKAPTSRKPLAEADRINARQTSSA